MDKRAVMEFLGISLRTLDRMIAERELPVIKIGHLVRFERVAVRELVERSRVGAGP